MFNVPMFSEVFDGFDVLTTNTSPLDPVIDKTNNPVKYNLPDTDSSNLQGNFLARIQ